MSKKNKQNVTSTKKIKKVRKIRYGRVFIILVIIFLILFALFNFIDFPIKNIYIKNNTLLSDQDIIELAHLENYPSIFKYSDYEIEKNLNKNIYIESSNVKKVALSKIYIEIEENYPIFSYSVDSLTYLKDGKTVEKRFNVPEVINYIPDTLFDEFVEKFKKIDRNIINKISQIEYKPNEVDEERFVFYMNDGNYIYLNLESLKDINKYDQILVQIIDKYGKKKGILYLDDGDYFEILEN